MVAAPQIEIHGERMAVHSRRRRRFGRLTILKRWWNKCKRRSFCKCRCKCGKTKTFHLSNVVQGRTSSCGCLNREILIARDSVHGMYGSREYRSWRAMIARCSRRGGIGWKRYGGRGIKICRQWRKSFRTFYEDMGPAPRGTSLDRFPDNNGNYRPGNCRWATRRKQARNKSNNQLLTLNGRTRCLTEWAERIGINASTISIRLRSGWTVEHALTIPLGARREARR